MQVHEDRRRVLAPVSTPNAAVALLRQRTFRQRAPTPRFFAPRLLASAPAARTAAWAQSP